MTTLTMYTIIFTITFDQSETNMPQLLAKHSNYSVFVGRQYPLIIVPDKNWTTTILGIFLLLITPYESISCHWYSQKRLDGAYYVVQ